MRKEQELTDPNSCLSKAMPGEMVFVLLGRDPDAPAAIRDWAAYREWRDARDPKVLEARGCANLMEQERPEILARLTGSQHDEQKTEIDFLLERFDQTEPSMQRQIVAEIVRRASKYGDLLLAVAGDLERWADHAEAEGLPGSQGTATEFRNRAREIRGAVIS